MNQQDFFIKWKDKYNNNGMYVGQCVNVIKSYFQEVLNREPVLGDAIDYWYKPPTGFQKIKNSFFAYPQPGDIIIWDIGRYGHIAVCNWVRTFDLGVFEQNYPIGTPCHFGTHNYKNVLGWLRPIKQREFSVVMVNSPTDFIEERIRFYAPHINFSFSHKTIPIAVSVGMFTGDQAMQLIDKTQKADAYLIFYQGNPTSTFEAASFYPAKNCSFATIPLPCPSTVPVHAMLHCLRKFINFNHLGPYIEDVEKYPSDWSDMANFDNPGWQFKSQYDEIRL